MKKFKIGVQLYSLRELLEKDFEGTIKSVSEMGYDCVEFAGYYDRSADEINAILKKYNLTAPSVHQVYNDFLENGEEKMQFLKDIGVKYLAIPGIWLEYFKGNPKYDKTLEEVKGVLELAKKYSMPVLYHNHAHEFKIIDGKYDLEWLLEDTGNVIMPELDVCWVKFAGIEPSEYMLKYKNRLPVVHMKDFTYGESETEPVMRPVGDGEVDVKAVLEAAEQCGSEYLIVEQDNFTDIEPLEAIEKSLKYLRSLGA